MKKCFVWAFLLGGAACLLIAVGKAQQSDDFGIGQPHHLRPHNGLTSELRGRNSDVTVFLHKGTVFDGHLYLVNELYQNWVSDPLGYVIVWRRGKNPHDNPGDCANLFSVKWNKDPVTEVEHPTITKACIYQAVDGTLSVEGFEYTPVGVLVKIRTGMRHDVCSAFFYHIEQDKWYYYRRNLNGYVLTPENRMEVGTIATPGPSYSIHIENLNHRVD
ncbi:MAG TPA: hypothetical protein P5119_12965 [Candidatus Aminicenantes bacterium]|nr:hypothetical protein [Candidatus Aminicenantes bacterium]HRY66237.1 hypothetical protein [Candidatus Aminicenantes bacterium]HRZ73151.1 hypothetical protein [Candidatus Aminicenantes bacterium]